MEMAKSIFRFLMEEGFYPTYEKTHIVFEFEDNPATLEYEKGLLTIRIFFTIEEESYDMFLEAGNYTMSGTSGVKAIILDDHKTLMFCTEALCDNMNEFKKFFPRSLCQIKDGLMVHRQFIKSLLQKNMFDKDLYTHDNEYNTAKKFCS